MYEDWVDAHLDPALLRTPSKSRKQERMDRLEARVAALEEKMGTDHRVHGSSNERNSMHTSLTAAGMGLVEKGLMSLSKVKGLIAMAMPVLDKMGNAWRWAGSHMPPLPGWSMPGATGLALMLVALLVAAASNRRTAAGARKMLRALMSALGSAVWPLVKWATKQMTGGTKALVRAAWSALSEGGSRLSRMLGRQHEAGHHLTAEELHSALVLAAFG